MPVRRRGWWAVVAGAAIGVLVMAGCSGDPEPTAFVVGDSLTVGAQIGGLGDDGSPAVDAQSGRTTQQATRVVEQTGLADFEQVIVAVGTNDYLDTEAAYAPKIDEMMAALGSALPVTWINVDTGTPKLAPAADGVNAALAAAADRHPNLTIADWDGYLNGRDDADALRSGDEVHDSSEGYRVRAEWMQDLIGS